MCVLGVLPWAYEGFATGDSIRYAMGLRALREGTPLGSVDVFNGELSFGYYQLIGGLAGFLGTAPESSKLLNYVSVWSTVALAVLAFAFYSRTLNNPAHALIAIVLLLFTPGIWFVGHYGHPGMPALAAFMASLVCLDSALARAHWPRVLYFVVFVVLTAAAICIRLDIVLAFGAYLGPLRRNGRLERASVTRLLAALAAVAVIVAMLRLWSLGYVVSPHGGTVAYHLKHRVSLHGVPRAIAKNLALWVASTNALVFGVVLLGLLRRRIRSQHRAMLACVIFPWFGFLPFRGMDMSRLVVPTIPIIVLVASAVVADATKRRGPVVLLGFCALAQLAASLSYKPLVTIYDFQREYEGRIIAAVPLGFPPADQRARQGAIRFQEAITESVVAERGVDVLLVGKSSLMEYRFQLALSRGASKAAPAGCPTVDVEEVSTPENRFFLLDLDHNAGVTRPIAAAMRCLKGRSVLIHVTPMWRGYWEQGDGIFLDDSHVARLIEGETSMRRQ